MARTKGKYSPNRCFQVHFQNNLVLASPFVFVKLHPRTVQRARSTGAFLPTPSRTVRQRFPRIHHWYGSVTLTRQSDTLTKLAAPRMRLESRDKSFGPAAGMRRSTVTRAITFPTSLNFMIGVFTGKGRTPPSPPQQPPTSFETFYFLRRQLLSRLQRLQTSAAARQNVEWQLNVNGWNFAFPGFSLAVRANAQLASEMRGLGEGRGCDAKHNWVRRHVLPKYQSERFHLRNRE